MEDSVMWLGIGCENEKDGGGDGSLIFSVKPTPQLIRFSLRQTLHELTKQQRLFVVCRRRIKMGQRGM